ncbi:MAG: hypothetical protein WBG42_09500, partial [Cryomorphaceae bacterium]
YDQLDAEANEMPVRIWLEVADAQGKLVRRVNGSTEKGFHRVAWDLRLPPTQVVSKGKEKIGDDSGLLAMPGTYQVRIVKETAEGLSALTEYRSFEVVPLHKSGALKNPLADQKDQFWRDYEKIMTSNSVMNKRKNTIEEQIKSMGVALAYVRSSNEDLAADYRNLRDDFYSFKSRVDGSPSVNKIGEKAPPTVNDRMWEIYIAVGYSTYGPTGAAKETMAIVKKEMAELMAALEDLEAKAAAMNYKLVAAGGPPVEGF